MSDEPQDIEHDDDIDRNLFFTKESDPELFDFVRNMVFVIPCVTGTKAPLWEAESRRCNNGCCTRVWLMDTANGAEYLVCSGPTFIATMQGWVDFNGNVNPGLIQGETLKHQASLN